VRRGLLPLVLLAGLVLGVGQAGGRTAATTTVTVEVIGKGTITSDPGGIKCGNGKRTCYLTFSGAVTLKADDAGGWDFDSWSGDCTPSGDTCDVADGADAVVFADFTTSATTTSTLTVTYDDTNGDGNVSGPEPAGGTEIDCGSSPAGGDCTWQALTGSTLTVFQSPASGDIFSGWGGACSGTGVSCTVELSGDRQVSAAWGDPTATQLLTVSVTGNGHVKGGGIDCPSACSASEPLNSSVTLKATPESGYTFTGWGGTACSGTGDCTVTMSDDVDVTASFARAVTLSVTVNGGGNVSGGSGAINCGNGATVCAAQFAANSAVTLIASPASGSTFAGWTGACGGTATTCTVALNESKGVTANFTGGAATGFTLTVAVTGNGTVTGGGISCGAGGTTCSSSGHAANSSVTLTATPASGATFTGWGGSCAGTTPTCTVVMASSRTVTASFSGGTSTFQVTISVSGPGTVTGAGIKCGNGSTTCTASVAAGSNFTLTATPAAGATFAGWSGACAGTGTTCSVLVNGAKSIVATFTGGGPPGTLTIAASGSGAVSTRAGTCAASGPRRTCVQHFAAGAKVVLTATPAGGAAFLGWGGACAGTARTCTLVLGVARAVTASFGAAPRATLASLGRPIVTRAGAAFRVTLRFSTTAGGVARVRGLRAGRSTVSLSLRVAAGRARIGPFPVALGGSYVFEVRLGGHAIRWPACLGLCGSAVKKPPFLLVREAPAVTRSGDVWSVTLHLRSNLIADDRVRAYRGSKLLVDQHFLGKAGEILVGPFLLGPGSYTLRLRAVDAYGRARTLTWIVALAR
jgi:uncharacterized repeat protein (TIGR02543 family)